MRIEQSTQHVIVMYPYGYRVTKMTKEQVTRLVVSVTGVSISKIKARTRKQEIKEARHCLVVALIHLCRMNTTDVAKYVGYDNRSTVSHAYYSTKALVQARDRIGITLEQIVPDVVSEWKRQSKKRFIPAA